MKDKDKKITAEQMLAINLNNLSTRGDVILGQKTHEAVIKSINDFHNQFTTPVISEAEEREPNGWIIIENGEGRFFENNPLKLEVKKFCLNNDNVTPVYFSPLPQSDRVSDKDCNCKHEDTLSYYHREGEYAFKVCQRCNEHLD